MKFKNPIVLEGDFLETYEGLIFDAKGIRHPDEATRKIAYLRYVPIRFFYPEYDFIEKSKKNWLKKQIEDEFDILVEDIRFGTKPYVKVYDLVSRFTLLQHFKPNYIFESKMFDFPLQTVPMEDIKTIYAPDQVLKSALSSKNPDSTLVNLIQFITTGVDISNSRIGLSGSKMVGLEGSESDYDLIIYGEEESRKVHEFLEDFLFYPSGPINYLMKKVKITPYTEDFLRKHYQFRANGFNITYDQFKRIESKKTHQFLIDNKEVYIRYLKNHRYVTHLPRYPMVSYKTLGRVSLVGRIIDDTESIFTPGRYLLFITEFRKGKELIDTRRIELFTFRGRFLENARVGDIVLVNGKLEKIIRKGKPKLQIVIGTNYNDLLIQMNRSSKKFN